MTYRFIHLHIYELQRMRYNIPMNKRGKRITIGRRLYIFIAAAVFLASFGASLLAYYIHARQIDAYYKKLSLNSAINFSAFVDGDFLVRLYEAASTDEYLELRDKAEEDDDEELISDYLKEHGLWDEYDSTRSLLIEYLRTMDDLEYLYIMKLGDERTGLDLYLMDDDENPLYVTGSTEEDNLEIGGATGIVPPSISHSEWGWLCSAYAPVYDSEGNLVCHIGCDISMDDVMSSRRRALLFDLLGSTAFTLIVMLLAIRYTRKTVIRPLDDITHKMTLFAPAPGSDYEMAGVIDLDLKNNDEIGDIYDAIQSMQKNIVDYINDLIEIRKEKEIAENDIRKKDKQIGILSKDAYRDALTNVGSKIAYTKKLEELNGTIDDPETEFAVVMVDVNFLKMINDKYGHASGDEYLKGCCKVICQIYKHSPVYRTGGDEFVAILTGEDYANRHERIKVLRDSFDSSYHNTDAEPYLRYSAASGMAEYTPGDDKAEKVFERADRQMYEEKAKFKKSLGIDPNERQA